MPKCPREPETEADVKADVKAYCKEIGAFYFMPVQMGYGRSAVDFLICWRGLFIAVETKKPGVTEPTARQEFTIKEIKEAGGQAIVINHVNQFKRLIDQLSVNFE
jgi:hypothetical protein